MTDGNTDTIKEAVESFIQTTMKEAVLSEGMPRTADDTKDAYATVDLLRALAAKLERVTQAIECLVGPDWEAMWLSDEVDL